MGKKISKDIVNFCKDRLLEARTEIENKFRDVRQHLRNLEIKGDEVDQTNCLLEEENAHRTNAQLSRRLRQVDQALERIKQGSYGICAETGEPIERRRLEALPWTDVSAEGAEIRESLPSKEKSF